MKDAKNIEPAGAAASPPARGRGLKGRGKVPSIALVGSPPARGRGLKVVRFETLIIVSQSPPARGRGLKEGHNISLDGSDLGRPLRGGVD